jgi:CTP:molybdopterin cytidylyltransferase MocA
MKIAGVVLAAGASRRMGTCKALLRFGAKTFLDHLCRALADGGCQPVVAVLSEPAEGVRSRCSLDGVDLVINPDPSRGQISSLRCAVRALTEVDGILVLLVDQGIIQARTVERVRKASSGSVVTVARFQGKPGHPACFSKEVFGDLLSPAADEGARAVTETYDADGRVRYVDLEDDPGIVRNLNTPADYQDFLERNSLR